MAVIFFDIDGTLWDKAQRIPESTTKAIMALKRKGHVPMLCSGRSKALIYGEGLERLGMRGMVAGCGTYAECDGKVLLDYEIEPDALRLALKVLREYQYPVLLEGSRYLYLDKARAADRFGASLFAQVPDRARRMELYEDDDLHGNKISAVTGKRSPEDLPGKLSKHFQVLLQKGYIEVIPKGYTKATGIKLVCQHLGIPREETYAVGDSVNDLDMLSYVQTGIAMGNATEDVKRQADYVTDDIGKDGLYSAMRHFGLI